MDTKLYKGIISSDQLIHNHINEILNLFNNSVVKIMSNAVVTQYKYVNGVKTDEIIGYDEEQLNRNANGCSNLLVKTNRGQYWDRDYVYVSSSVLYENNSETLYFNVPIDFIDITKKFPNNIFLVYSKLDDAWFMFHYRDVAKKFDENFNNNKCFFSYRGYRYFKYELDLSKGRSLDKTPNENSKYFANVHIGVTRYSKTIAGTHCFIRVFSRATGKPTTKQPTEFKSFTEAFNMLKKWEVLDDISKKTFVRKVYTNELFETENYIFQCSTEPELLLKTIETTTTIIDDNYFGVVEIFKSFDEVIDDADIEMAKQKGMTYQEFLDYCINKYNANWDEENCLMTEVVSPEEIEAVDENNIIDESTIYYRRLGTDNDKVDLL